MVLRQLLLLQRNSQRTIGRPLRSARRIAVGSGRACCPQRGVTRGGGAHQAASATIPRPPGSYIRPLLTKGDCPISAVFILRSHNFFVNFRHVYRSFVHPVVSFSRSVVRCRKARSLASC
jgi:hypothetical protein